MRAVEQKSNAPGTTTATAQRSASPWRGVLLLTATVAATEAMMLNVIFLARAQASLAGLALAVVWPWVAALASVVLWATRERWLPALARRAAPLQPNVSLGIAAALAAIVLIGRLVVAA